MSSVPNSSSSAEICLLTAGWPIPRSFATAEKLPFSTTRTNICIASNLSTRTSVFLYGMDAMQGIAIHPHRYAFLLGTAVVMSTQVVLITGALTGIGGATAMAFAAAGANVVVA